MARKMFDGEQWAALGRFLTMVHEWIDPMNVRWEVAFAFDTDDPPLGLRVAVEVPPVLNPGAFDKYVVGAWAACEGIPGFTFTNAETGTTVDGDVARFYEFWPPPCDPPKAAQAEDEDDVADDMEVPN